MAVMFLWSYVRYFLRDVINFETELLLDAQQQRHEKGSPEALSGLSISYVQKMSDTLRVRMLYRGEDLRVAGANQVAFTPFPWGNRKEDSAIDEVYTYLNNDLTARGILADGGYKLYNTHASRSLLNSNLAEDITLCGSTDFVIAPDGLKASTCRSSLCILFEIKSGREMQKGIENFLNQGYGEAFAARCLSAQPNVMVIISDLATKATELTFEYNAAHNKVCLIETDVSLLAMVDRIAVFLDVNCEADALFDVKEMRGHPRPQDQVALTFFDTITAVGGSGGNVVADHWAEMMEDAKDVEEKAEILAEMFRVHDQPVPSILSNPFKEDYS